MNIVKRVFPFLLICLSVVLLGCTQTVKSEVKEAITNELDLLKNLDSETAQKYISYSELFPGESEPQGQTSFAEVNDVFTLFFKNFDYRIHKINVAKDKSSATAVVDLTTLDAQALAADYASARLENEIETSSGSGEPAALSTREQYLLLNHLLKTKEYDTVKNECTLSLVLKDQQWQLEESYSTENSLVGGLIAYLSNPDILPPDQTLSIYLETLKKMNLQQMSSYLGIVSILSTDNPDKDAIAEALVKQVRTNFNYKIKDSELSGYTAQVATEITTFDSEAILSSYQQQLDDYLATASAVIDGSEVRQRKARTLLLDIIQKNTSTVTTEAVFHLVNDGVSWKLSDPSEELGQAIFGTLTSDPVDDSETEQ